MAGRISNPLSEAPKDAWWHYRAALILKNYPKVATEYLQIVLDDAKASKQLKEQATEALERINQPRVPAGGKRGGYGPDDCVPF